VPEIRHAEPTTELEYFDPQLRDKDPVRQYHRSSTHLKEKHKVTLLTDPNKFAQAIQQHVNTAEGGGSSTMEAGIRVDLVASLPAPTNRVWKQADLSNQEGNICLLEYAERDPLIQNGTGMCSNVINFYLQSDEFSLPTKPNLGLFVGLHPDEPSPLMTKILPGRVYRVCSLFFFRCC
jgi:hypothetical protein